MGKHFSDATEASLRDFGHKLAAAVDFVPEGEVIPYDIVTEGIVLLRFCPQCGAEVADKYEAALHCDQRLPGESEDAQLIRLFADEIAEAETQARAELESEARVQAPSLIDPPLDIEALQLRLRPGDQIVLRLPDKYYNGRLIELHTVNAHGASGTFADEEWPINKDGLKVIHGFGWPFLAHCLDHPELIKVIPYIGDKPYERHERLAYIAENEKRIKDNHGNSKRTV